MDRRNHQAEIFVVGPVFLDLIYYGLPGMPELGKEFYCEEFSLSPGGISITAIGLARLHQPVQIVSSLACDFFGTPILKMLQKEGVLLDMLQIEEDASTNSTLVLSYQKDRALVTKMGSQLKEGQLLEKLVRGHCLSNYSLLHVMLSGDLQIHRQLKEIRNNYPDILISLVASWDGVEVYKEKRQLFSQILQYSDLIFCNDMEAQHLFGGTDRESWFQRLKSFQIRPVITLGQEGAMSIDESQEIISLSPLNVQFLDSTGAGDSFTAGFLAAYFQGHSIERALKIGNICGALSTEGLGGTYSFPRKEQVEKLLGERYQ